MFDRFIRFARARRALREQRYPEALQMGLDPVIRDDRRAEQVRDAAVAALVAAARRHLQAGELELAQRQHDNLKVVEDLPAVLSLGHDVAAARAALAEQRATATAAVARARSLVQAGQLAAAERELATAPEGADVAALRSRIDDQRHRANELLGAEAAAGDSWQAEAQRLLRAELLDRDGAAVVAARAALLARAWPELERRVAAHLAAADVPAALAAWRDALVALPALGERPVAASMRQQLADALAQALVRADDLPIAAGLAQAAQAVELPIAAPVAHLVDCLLGIAPWTAAPDTLAPTGARTERAAAAAALGAAAETVGASGLVAAVQPWLRVAAAHEERLQAARALVAAGDLDAARGLLVAFLAEEPLHAGARAEIELVDAALAELERRLGDARTALRAGRLRQAIGTALAIAGSSRLVAAAQQLVVEARARIAVVERGLDEVRVALHGRAAATSEGVRHCLLRLGELAKVQVDHEELPKVLAAVESEVAALAVHDPLVALLRDGALAGVAERVRELLAFRPRLLAPERLDARLCDIGDAIERRIDSACTAGRLDDVSILAAALDALAVVRDSFGAAAARWRHAVAERRRDVEAKLQEARAALGQRNLAEADRLVESALALWADGGPARAFAAELQKVRQQAAVLERAASMVKAGDLVGAEQKLASLPVAEPLLRTRVYDMKQDLARAQGLEGAFLLRVDEGGEHLVWRGETMTVGNVRQRRADLPVLANLAGCHASIRRSMSFHGGMQDELHAEEGEVRLAGTPIQKRRLQSGDRVQLGSALGLAYRLPSSRSLSAAVTLLGGFQVAGTDRLLLMKDRGRDGRLLIGPGQDVHVRVARATCELEVYANPSGQMRVACAQEGTIDGAPFRGEHPVAAGQVVVAGGITLVMLPWRASASL